MCRGYSRGSRRKDALNDGPWLRPGEESLPDCESVALLFEMEKNFGSLINEAREGLTQMRLGIIKS